MRQAKDPNAIRQRLRRLAEMVQALEDGGRDFRGQKAVPTGWPEVDDVLISPRYGEKTPTGQRRRPPLRGLLRGAVHEWFGLAETNVEASKRQNVETSKGGQGGGGTRTPTPSYARRAPISGGRGRDFRGWVPALCVLTHLAWQALTQLDRETAAPGSSGDATSGSPGSGAADSEGPGAGYVVWIGRAVRPYPHLLLRGRTPVGRFASSRQSTANTRDRLLLERSLFIDPPDGGTRLWAIDLALRCPAVSAVIADGRGLSMSQTRRLQLAAEAGGALVLLARPPEEAGELSAAMTRWRVSPTPSATDRPRWIIELLHRKGARGGLNVTAASEVRPTRPPAAVEEATTDGFVHFRGPGAKAGMRHWLLEWNHVQGVVAVPAEVVDRSGETPPGAAVSPRPAAESGPGARRTA
jgi:hypothetical protein